MKLQIITLSPEQWQEWKNLRLEALKTNQEYFADPFEEVANRPDDFWINRLKEVTDGKSFLFVAEVDGQLVGSIGAYFDKDRQDTAKIVGMFVKPEFRRQGIASQLAKHLLLVLSEDKRVQDVILHVNDTNNEAIGLYKKFGFEVVGTKNKLMGDSNYHDLFEMRLK